jgi:hypothetical protein
MTKHKIVKEISRLPLKDRRDILGEILGMEPEAAVYDELTHSANEAFLMLDELERKDAEASESR